MVSPLIDFFPVCIDKTIHHLAFVDIENLATRRGYIDLDDGIEYFII